MNHRRIVTGIDEDGRATITIDDNRALRAGEPLMMWRSTSSMADNSGLDDAVVPMAGLDLMTLREGNNFVLVKFEPGFGASGPYMHASNTLDYIIVLQGRLELVVETGSVELGPGDVVVDRGVFHGWRALGDEPVIYAAVLLPALPVGQGVRF